MNRRNILLILAAAVIAVGSAFATKTLLEWRDHAADEACFAAPEPGCLLDAAERMAGRTEADSRRALALRTVARGRGRVGELAGMRGLLERATEAALADAEANEPDLRWPDQTLMSKIVTAWEEAGDRERALALANQAPDPAVRGGRREALVGFLVRQGDFEDALAVAASFEDSLETARLLADITRAQLAQEGGPDLDSVLARIGAIAAGLADEAEQVETHSLIGQLQALAGRTEEALATADALGHEHRRDWIIETAILERARHGGVNEALALADRIADPSARVSFLCYATSTRADAGDLDGVIALLDGADRIVRTIEDDDARNNSLGFILRYRAEYSDASEALAIIEKTEDGETRDQMYSTRADRLADLGEMEAALEMVEMMSPGFYRFLAFRAIATRAAESGEDSLARKILKLMVADAQAASDSMDRDSWLETTSESQAELGYLDDAEETLALLEDGFYRENALSPLAVARARAGDLPGALEALAAMSEDHYERNGTLGRIAMVTAEGGDPASAIVTLRGLDARTFGHYLVRIASPDEIETERRWRPSDIEYSDPPPPPPTRPEGWDECLADPTDECILGLVQEVAEIEGLGNWSDDLLVRAARAWARLEQMDKAYEAMAGADRHARVFFEMLKKNPRRDMGGGWDTGNMIVEGWAGIGGWDQAEAFIEVLPEDHRGYPAEMLARAYVRAGKLDAAIALSDRTPYPMSRSDMLYYIAKARIEHGDEDAARAIMATIRGIINDNPEASWRTGVMRNLANLEARFGRFEKALKITANLDEPRERDRLLRDIAEIHAEGGDLDQAWETLRGIEDSMTKASGFWLIGESTAKAGRNDVAEALFDEALEIAEAMPPGEVRDRAYDGMAWWLAEAGYYERAMHMPVRIDGMKRRSDAYQSIARRMIRAGAPDEAGPMLVKAMKAASEIPELDSRDNTIGNIAEHWAKTGDFATALETADRIEDKDDRSRTIGDIAVEMSRHGELAKAMEIVGERDIAAATHLLARIASPNDYDW